MMKTPFNFYGQEFFISIDPPPKWVEIQKFFPDASLEKQIFAYADTVHWKNQLSNPLGMDLIAHEVTHLKQQHFSIAGAVKWWDRYARDPQFRVEQEIEACIAQLNEARKMTSDRNRIYRLAMTLADNLSSEIYNRCISKQAAFDRLMA